MRALRQYSREGYPVGFTLADVLLWAAAVWMDGLGAIKLDRKSYQHRGGFYYGGD